MSGMLVYRGAATLTFGTETGRRTVRRGEPFEVGAKLASTLLAEPDIEVYVDPQVATEAPAEPAAGSEPTRAALLERALSLGLALSTRATKPVIAAAVEAEEQRLADEAEASSSGESDQGGSTPADDPDAVAAEEAGRPPSSTGVLTLGDLPEGAKVK